jgi:ACS family tartrate transporter-like MFS transporter
MTDEDVDPRIVRRKVVWRIVPLIFVLYVVAYLDRANVGFAKLQMEKKLPGFTPEVFGWGFGIFFAGYLLLEIPGALLVEHWSARKWFARILITWGFCSMGLALVRTPWQFYLARFLLGLAEAGFFPGVIVYFTHWFPRAERGRAMAGLVLGVPLSLALGSQVSGLLLQQTWFGLDGWKLLFIFEGLPAVLLGVALPFIMTDRPRHAKWLTAGERDWLEQKLEAERRETASRGSDSWRNVFRQPAVWLLALGILATNTGGYGFVFWMPTVVKDHLFETQASAGSAPKSKDEISDTEALRWTGLVYAFGLLGVLISGLSSDWTGDRKWHCVTGQVLTGVFLAASVIPGLPWAAVIVILCCVGFFATFWPPPFWVLPTLTMSASAAAVSIGFINICANIAGLFGPPLIGTLKTAGFSDWVGMTILAGFYVLGGIFVSLLRIGRGESKCHESS